MFVIGAEYFRSELLSFLGSKQAQSGISWGAIHPDCVIVTSGGKHSISAGYDDVRDIDGSWTYIGQGAKGDQDPRLFSNKILIDGEHSVLLFSTREPTLNEVKLWSSHQKRYRFEGIFGVRGWEYFIPSSGKRANDKLLLFHLVPAKNIYYGWELEKQEVEEDDLSNLDLYKIKESLRNNGLPYTGMLSPKEYKRATANIRKYAMLRGNGFCEYCNCPAPFKDANGFPYLEIHHLHRLADDGPDSPANVAALCPNCHRMAHFGQNKAQMGSTLKMIVGEKETSLEKRAPN